MEDIIQPLIVILVGGIFAPILIQLMEKAYEAISNDKKIAKPQPADPLSIKRKKWIRFFVFAILIQLTLFTGFFFLSKWIYFDKNYFRTMERELIRIGIKKGKDYVIPKMTIRIYSESPKSAGLTNDSCENRPINYCMLISISYEIIALREYNSEKIFSEYYYALYATNVIKEPGSEIEGPDFNPLKTHLVYDLTTTMKKYERKTITTRADFLYESLPGSRDFFSQKFAGHKFDMFYYPNKEDDVIGEVEFQIISRSLRFQTPSQSDAIYERASGKQDPINTTLTLSNDSVGCLHFNILTAKIPSLYNNENFGIKWSWSN